MHDIEQEIQNRIVSDPRILSGKPVIRGTRISVAIIIDRLWNGVSETEIVEDYPSLSLEDVQAALAFHLRQTAVSTANA
jgi:uncharacterized protein (DUF433 family)